MFARVITRIFHTDNNQELCGFYGGAGYNCEHWDQAYILIVIVIIIIIVIIVIIPLPTMVNIIIIVIVIIIVIIIP